MRKKKTHYKPKDSEKKKTGKTMAEIFGTVSPFFLASEKEPVLSRRERERERAIHKSPCLVCTLGDAI